MWGKGNNNNGEYDNEDKSYRRLKITAIVLAVVAVVLGASFAIGLNLGGSSSKRSVAVSKENKETESSVDNSNKETVSQPQEENTEAEVDNGYNVEDLYYEVHLRVNTIIIAEDGEIWEEIAIDRDFLDKTVPLLKGKDDYLYNELLKWNDLDFSNAVEVHNYVWEKLDGTVGKAIGINEEAVQALKERLLQ